MVPEPGQGQQICRIARSVPPRPKLEKPSLQRRMLTAGQHFPGGADLPGGCRVGLPAHGKSRHANQFPKAAREERSFWPDRSWRPSQMEVAGSLFSSRPQPKAKVRSGWSVPDTSRVIKVPLPRLRLVELGNLPPRQQRSPVQFTGLMLCWKPISLLRRTTPHAAYSCQRHREYARRIQLELS